MSNFDSRRQGTGSSVSSQGSAGPTPGKRTLTEIASHPLHMAREVSPDGRLPPLKPGAALPVSMLSHLGSADPDREFDEALPMKDKYVDASAPNRATATSPGVQTDNSLMGNYPSEGRAKAEVKLRHAQTIAGQVGGASGHSFTVSKK